VESSEGLADRELMRRVQAGDAAAFDQLIKLYWDSMAGYADRMLMDIDAAHDVVQEAFARLWQRRTEWEPIGSVRSYLYRSVRNLVVDSVRRRDAKARFVELQQHVERTRPPTPDQDLEGEELLVAAERAIQALPAKRREVFTLGHLQSRSYQEMSEILGISVQTVANHMTLALADLRRMLTPFLENRE